MSPQENSTMKLVISRAILQDSDDWRTIVGGTADEIVDTAKALGLDKPLTEEEAALFVTRREEYLSRLRRVVEEGTQQPLESATELFKKGIRVMDHPNPASV
jgi:hypothetical protein